MLYVNDKVMSIITTKQEYDHQYTLKFGSNTGTPVNLKIKIPAFRTNCHLPFGLRFKYSDLAELIFSIKFWNIFVVDSKLIDIYLCGKKFSIGILKNFNN